MRVSVRDIFLSRGWPTPVDALKAGGLEAGDFKGQELKMRKIILLGTTVVALTFGVANAYAMGGGGNISPEQSPYAILAPQTLGPSWTNEGRSVYTGPDGYYGAQPGSAAPAIDSKGAPRHQRRQY
jgi:hypothetical protein